MTYVSDVLGKPVFDVNGLRVGRLTDLIASSHVEIPHPRLVALVIKRRRLQWVVPFSDVAVLLAPSISLKRSLDDVAAYVPKTDDLYLVRDVLDKQIIDVNGVRVVRVNDLEMTRVNSDFYVANVDTGSIGLLRRLGFGRAVQIVAGRLGRGMPAGTVPWSDVELLPGEQSMRLKVPSDKIAELHPADLAEILGELSRTESNQLLQSLDVPTLADTLEEVEPDFQASLVETLSDEKVADVLGEMEPDEAADLLAELPQDRSQELLRLMERDESEDVRRLLAYPVDTAGSIMTPAFAVVGPDLTAAQAIATLRATAAEAETIFYVYVTEPDGRLVGVFSLRQLIMAQPDTPVREIMEKRVIAVEPLARQDNVAQIVAKYDLLAVPVVDTEGRIHGIVTADDALDMIIPTAWKQRIPRLYH